MASLHEGLSPQNGHHLGAPQHLAPQPASSTATQDPANPALAEHLLDAESFALVVHPDGEVSCCGLKRRWQMDGGVMQAIVVG